MSGENRGDLEVPDSGLIQSGPETEQQHPDESRELSPREIAMAKIFENRERVMAEEMQAAEEQVEQRPEHSLEHDDDDEDARQHRQPRREAEQAPQQSQAPQHDPNQDLVWADLGDGRGPIQVTREQDQQLRAWGMAAVQAMNVHHQQQQQYQQPRQPTGRGIVDEERISEAVRAIQYGDEAAARGALKGLISDVVQKTPDPEAVINRRLAEAQQQQYVAQAQVQLRAEFPDIFADAIRTDAAARQVAYLRSWAAQNGWRGDQMEIFRQAAVNVRNSMGTGAPQQSGRRQASYSDGSNLVVRRSSSEIEDRKRAAPRAFSQVIDRRSPGPSQSSRAPSGSEIVQRMRELRGQS